MSWIRIGSCFMLAGVALGAFGAHGLKDRLSPASLQVYQTAVLYHLIHGLGLLAVGWLAVQRPAASLVGAAGCAFASGILLFSGSLYALAVTGHSAFGLLTPFGGLVLLIGWLCLALAAR